MEASLTNLCVQRGGLALLEGVSLTLRAGEALVIRGPNGIGKTSLLRTLAGLQPPLSGTCAFPSEELIYCAHTDGLKASLSVRENLGFWAEIYGQGAARAEEAMERMALLALSERRGGELSAGQKRRLGLARLLLSGRRIWLLDEPTVSLDTASVHLFAEQVRAHLAQGGAALIATHIDLGLPEARLLDLGPFAARSLTCAGKAAAARGLDEAFL